MTVTAPADGTVTAPADGTVTTAPAADGTATAGRYPPRVALTCVELAALLQLRPGPAADLARDRLALGPPNAQLSDAGTASLLSRGYLTLGPDRRSAGPQTARTLRPVGPALVLAHVLTTPGSWLTIACGDPHGRWISLLVDAGTVAVVIDPAPDGSVTASALPAGYRAARAVAEAVMPYLDEHRPAVASVTVSPRRGGQASMAVSRDAEGRWWSHAHPAGPATETDRPAVLSRITDLVDAGG